MNFAEVLSIAHRPMVKRQNMSSGAPLTHKINLADGAHPHLYRPMYLLLMRNVALWVRKGLRAVKKRAIFHLKETSPYFVAGAQAGTINMPGTTLLSHQLVTHKNSPPSVGFGLKWKRLLET